jgi:multiple sugar transport system ATP-binding protein
VEVAGFRLAVPEDVLAARPDLKKYVGKKIVLGIRPENMEDASLIADPPADRRITSTVGLREALGSDVLVHFVMKAPGAATEDVRELASDVGLEALAAVEHGARQGESNFIARLSPRTTAREGDPIELVVDTRRLHFFDPDDGMGIYGDNSAPAPN